ncbi:MAG: S-formylglutathione hydrolase [Gammaproteobacteria bacterium]|nr:S-formylglutathione hydrolase [Gammaproteobacteria bacterium]
MSTETVSSIACFGGRQFKLKHRSEVLGCEMTFSVYLPPQAAKGLVPTIWWLSGLTCTDDNFVQKAGAQRYAAEAGVAIVCPDTSPRGDGVPDDPDGAWDFGLGAGFYVNATQSPWSANYRMYDYVVDELPRVLAASDLPLNVERSSIMGHSMGGHGALTIALKNPGKYKSVSAFAPICAPLQCPWGEKALGNYLGPDRDQWRDYDACELIAEAAERLPILVDQGQADSFLKEQLKPELLERACDAAKHPLTLRMQPGYDHSYFFIATFIVDHIRHHARALAVA